MGASTTIILVRHGQTEWNRTKRYQGHSDIPLNETGQMQAKRVGNRLASFPIRAVYSSDLTRAVQTAAAIALPHGLAVRTCASFRELNFGLWEGLTYEEIMAGWPAWLTAMYARPSVGYAPQGESFPLVQRRALEGLNACVAAHPGETIALVSHGGPLRTLLCTALGRPIDEVWSLKQDTTAVNILKYSEGLLQLVLANDTLHLKEDE